MLWGGRRGQVFLSLETTDGAPYATAKRLEQIPRRPRAGYHAHCRHRDEPIELARCRDRPRDRAAPAEEARAGRGSAAAATIALAGRSPPEGPHGQAHRRRLSSSPDRFWLTPWPP